jgi:hypothetical protein
MGRRCTAERTVMRGTDPCGIGKAARSWPPRTAAESPVLHGGRAGHCFPRPFRALVHVQGATLHYSPRSSYTGPGWPIGDVTSGLLHPDVVVVATHARTETEGTFAGPQGGTITARTRIESHLLDPAGRTSDDCAGCGHSSSLQPSRGFWTLDGLTQESDQVVRSIVYITHLHSFIILHVLLSYTKNLIQTNESTRTTRPRSTLEVHVLIEPCTMASSAHTSYTQRVGYLRLLSSEQQLT